MTTASCRSQLAASRFTVRLLDLVRWLPARPIHSGLAAILILESALASLGAGEPVEFNRDVRPILSDKCYACHGPDSGAREADLRLDRREDVVADRGGYQVVAPGKPDESELVVRVTEQDDDMRMPPADAGEPLTAEQQQVLTRWIAEGAVWEDHWSLTPLARPDTPNLEDRWVKNPVDQFILRRLERASLRPAEQADRRTLVRRLFFDLTGLPPAAEQVEAFAAATEPQAYEALVDQLLESSHYGERMAMYWLDLVRYADTLGYHGDQERSVSPYRDYVIRAFNDNMPFDQFTIENLAGDLIPGATIDQRVASTYNRLNRASAEGGVQPKEYLAKYAADRVRTTGSVWLGSTLGCAECHDHKFDPFTAKDFYRFEAFFADIKEQGIVSNAKHIGLLPVPTPEQRRELARLSAAITDAQTDLQQQTGFRQNQFAQWQQQLRAHSGPWVKMTPQAARSASGATLEICDDGGILASGENPAQDTYTVELTALVDACSAIRLEVLPDPSLPANGPGRAGNGNFVLQRLEVKNGKQVVKWKSATATHSQAGFAVENLAKGNDKGWAILPNAGRAVQAVLVPAEPIKTAPSNESNGELSLTVTLTQNHGDHHTLGRFRLYAGTGGKPLTAADIVPPEVRAALEVVPEQRTTEQTELLWERFRTQAPALAAERDALARWQAEKDKLSQQIITSLAVSTGEPRTIRVLPRGNWMDDSGEVVEPGVPHFLRQPEISDRRLNRLDLARWIVARDNPLTARTFVNRLWMLFYGQGLSRSVDDLGSQGQWPTHPELLDWLAAEFIDSGWDVKHIVRLLVTANAYRQSSAMRPELSTRDPYNKLLARQGRWRLEAEFVRDNALSVSGLLNPQIGGPSVRPYQPAGYWDQLNFPKRTYQHDTDRNQYRRGLYTHWQRTFLHPSLLAFDAPVREECTAQRSRSNTPLQALVLMNDPTYVEAARVLAAASLNSEADDSTKRIDWIYRRVLQRQPRRDEYRLLQEFLHRNRDVYRQAPEEAGKLLAIGLAPVPDETDPLELASWTCVARVILNLHETITRY